MAELRGVWEMPPRGGLHRVGLGVVIPAPSLGRLGRICAGGSEVMPRLGGERGADGGSAACLAPLGICAIALAGQCCRIK